jgi:hypothetical protein
MMQREYFEHGGMQRGVDLLLLQIFDLLEQAQVGSV